MGTEAPVLLRIPKPTKENAAPAPAATTAIPLLKVNLSKLQRNGGDKDVNIFRLPREYTRLPLIPVPPKQETPPPKPAVPKLIDIRSVLSSRSKGDSKTKPRDTRESKPREIKLVRIPQPWKDELPTQRLLESPRRKVAETAAKAAEKEPVLVDIRPFTPRSPSPKQLLKNTKPCDCKRADTVASTGVSVSATNRLTQVEQQPQQQLQQRQHHRRHSDELYEVLSELLMDRREKKRKKKHRRIGLFDVIDNLPLTSDSEVDDDVPLVKANKVNKRNTNKHVEFTSELTQPAGSSSTVGDNRESGIPPYTLDKYRPKSPLLGNDDALSWANIIKAARQETIATQTEQKVTCVLKSTEIQTEMKEMLEVPRTQTFFSTETVVQKTEEFCDRVRKEVVEKLDTLSRREDKFCQTISNVGVQTEDEEDTSSQKGDREDKNSENVQAEGSTAALVSHLPPDMLTQIDFLERRSVATREFINVVDFDEAEKPIQVQSRADPSSIFKLESIDEYMVRVTEETVDCDGIPDGTQKQVVQGEIVETDVTVPSNDPIPAGTYSSVEDVGSVPGTRTPSPRKLRNRVSFEDCESNGRIHEGSKDDVALSNDTPAAMNEYNELPLASINEKLFRRTKKKPLKKQKAVSKTDTSEKGVLQTNISEFSVGLQALNEIHVNLEKELRQSKFLYGMIESLQDGFLSDTSDVGEAEQEGREEDDQEDIAASFESEIGTLHQPVSPEMKEIHKHFSPELQEIRNSYSPKTKDVRQRAHEEVLRSSRSPSKYFSRVLEDFLNSEDMMLLEDELRTGHSSPARSKYRRSDRVSFQMSSHQSSVEMRVEDVYEDDLNGKGPSAQDRDESLKHELELKICKTSTSQELKAKQEAEKRAKLLKWIQKKKIQRDREYLEDLAKKREAEHRPFISQSKVSGATVKLNVTTQKEKARGLLQTNNEERLQHAEQLAASVMVRGKPLDKRKVHSQTIEKNRTNNRYGKVDASLAASEVGPLIAQTRASKVRKSALVSQIAQNQQLRKNSDGAFKHGQKTYTKTIVTTTTGKKAKTRKGKSAKKPPSATPKAISNKSKAQKMKGLRNIRGYHPSSPQRSVDARDFVTQISYDEYMAKPRLQRSVNGVELSQSFEFPDNVQFRSQALSSSRMSSTNILGESMQRSMSGEKDDLNVSVNSSTKNYQVRGLLSRFGMDTDPDLFEKGTSQLLAEADIALLEESETRDETSLVTEDIDWNEIDKILDE